MFRTDVYKYQFSYGPKVASIFLIVMLLFSTSGNRTCKVQETALIQLGNRKLKSHVIKEMQF